MKKPCPLFASHILSMFLNFLSRRKVVNIFSLGHFVCNCEINLMLAHQFVIYKNFLLCNFVEKFFLLSNRTKKVVKIIATWRDDDIHTVLSTVDYQPRFDQHFPTTNWRNKPEIK